MDPSGFVDAGQPDIVQAARRDAGAITMLATSLKDSLALLLGNGRTSALGAEIGLLAGALYYGVNGLRSRATLGEEYCDIVQVDRANSRVSPARGLGLMALHVLIPYVANRIFKKIQNRLARNESSTSELLQRVLAQAEALLQFWLKAHLAVFYFTGTFYEPGKRFAQIRFVHTRKSSPEQMPFKMLGVLIAIQLTGTALGTAADTVSAFVAWCRSSSLKAKAGGLGDTGEVVEEEPSTKSCTMCLEGMNQPTATSCGHVFCWECISDWVVEKPECPLCRQVIAPNRFLRVHHYA
eukprot:TRINITY_DN2177_c0_g1_i1.p1 TRINITY_DN2177_c0_g1~~TRINITY_DN2177_c0_g1_i1.p1  ORF type:complete len:295 (-),score=63.22 TRINITY_DN2177_c0_g1_i1:208-1092(-)